MYYANYKVCDHYNNNSDTYTYVFFFLNAQDLVCVHHKHKIQG